nr:MAG: hypothetical protein E4H34_04425 [Hyphomicrobiales bacterium]
MKSIADKAEISIDFADKAYMGSFGHESSFEVKVDSEEVLIHIARLGAERRQVAVHLHYLLLAEIFEGIGEGLAAREPLDDLHRDALRDGVDALLEGLKKRKPKSKIKTRKHFK